MTVYYVMGSPPEDDAEHAYLSPRIESLLDAERALQDLAGEWESWFLWIEEEEAEG